MGWCKKVQIKYVHNNSNSSTVRERRRGQPRVKKTTKWKTTEENPIYVKHEFHFLNIFCCCYFVRVYLFIYFYTPCRPHFGATRSVSFFSQILVHVCVTVVCSRCVAAVCCYCSLFAIFCLFVIYVWFSLGTLLIILICM